jgi:hypothetical protein
MFAAADPVEEVAAPSASERPSQSEALAFGIADAVAAQPIERVDPTPVLRRVSRLPR